MEQMNSQRREVLKKGIKLAFVAPVISTFFAQDAMAYVHSCYPTGHDCSPSSHNAEPCCNGLICTPQGAGPPRCQ